MRSEDGIEQLFADFDATIRAIEERTLEMSPEMEELCDAALKSLEEREGEDIDEWATRLANDICARGVK